MSEQKRITRNESTPRTREIWAAVDAAAETAPELFKRRVAGAERDAPDAATVMSACMWYRHDFGLLDDEEAERVMFTAREWLRAWRKALASEALPVDEPREQPDGWIVETQWEPPTGRWMADRTLVAFGELGRGALEQTIANRSASGRPSRLAPLYIGRPVSPAQETALSEEAGAESTDHAELREALRALIHDADDFEPCQEACDRARALLDRASPTAQLADTEPALSVEKLREALERTEALLMEHHNMRYVPEYGDGNCKACVDNDALRRVFGPNEELRAALSGSAAKPAEPPKFEDGERVMVDCAQYRGPGVVEREPDGEYVFWQDGRWMIQVRPWIGSWANGRAHSNVWRYPASAVTKVGAAKPVEGNDG